MIVTLSVPTARASSSVTMEDRALLNGRKTVTFSAQLVGTLGVEPRRIAPSDFKSLASTSSAMSPADQSLIRKGFFRR